VFDESDSHPGSPSHVGRDGVLPGGVADVVRWAVPGVPFDRPADAQPSLLSAELAASVAAAQVVVREMAAVAQVGFPADDGYALIAAQRRLRAVEEQLTTVRLTMLPLIERSDAWRLDEQVASGRFATWLARHDNITKGAANREVHTATLLAEQLPATHNKALAGELTTEQVRLMCTVAATSQARLAALHNHVTNWQPPNSHSDQPSDSAVTSSLATSADMPDTDMPDTDMADTGASDIGLSDGSILDGSAVVGDGSTVGVPGSTVVGSEGASLAASIPTGEQFLLDLAGRSSLYQFGRMVRRFAHVSDPESDERGYKEAEDREYFQISPTMGGYQLNGFLTEEHGLTVKTAVNNLMDKSLNLSGGIVAARAARTNSQRAAQALADLAQLAMDTGMLGGGAIERRELVVHVSWSELQNVLANTTCNTNNPAIKRFPAVDSRQPGGNLETSPRIDAAVFADPTADFATGTYPVWLSRI